MRVLVVDGSVDAAETMTMLVQTYGHHARRALTGRDAIEIALEWRPDLVLLDLNLPDLHGLTVARRLLNLHARGYRPHVVACTAVERYLHPDDEAALGIKCWLVKPVDLKELQPWLEVEHQALPNGYC